MRRLRQLFCGLRGHRFRLLLLSLGGGVPVEWCTRCGRVRSIDGARVVSWVP